jgi:hypothetical protein
MAETTDDVRRDIELTRERMSSTLQQLEQKLNVKQIVRDNPWPAIALAVGAGVLLSGSRTDVKAAAATVAATRGASTRVGGVLDDVVANLVSGLHASLGVPSQAGQSSRQGGDGAGTQQSARNYGNTPPVDTYVNQAETGAQAFGRAD